MHVTKYLEQSATLYPSKLAVIDNERSFTYDSLLRDSRRVASFLIEKNLIKMPIAIFMDKSYETLTSFLGINYARSFYSVINPDFPDIRIKHILEVLNSKVIIVNSLEYERIKMICDDSYHIYLIEEILSIKENLDLIEKLKVTYLDTDPIYCNFTSGSTGIPKGVLISNKNVLDFIDTFTETFRFSKDDLFANQAPFDFDVSTKDIYSSLKVGGTLIIVPRVYFSRPKELMDYLAKSQPTILIWAVSALCLITTFHGLDYKLLDTLKMVLFSGEVMPKKHLRLWQEKLPNVTYVNLYGPTEITCNVTYFILDNNLDYEKLPIGKAFKNEEVFLLDDNNQEITKAFEVGELMVKGSCVGLGYYNNPLGTSKAFIQNPLNSNYLETVYKTNDLAYFDLDGNYYFSGRKDFQIKYKGHRIELEEIEKYLNEISEVIRAVVLFNEKKEKLLCCYVGNINKNDLVSKLEKKLPVFMIPNKFISLAELPLTKNGKVDRKKLKEELC